MNRLDDAIANVAYILDSLMALRNIYDSGSCNDCILKGKIQCCPQPGQMVRYNCPYWAKEGAEKE